MKKLIGLVLIFFLQISAYGYSNATDNYTGRWAEKISERVVMDIYKDKGEYKIYISWRENNLAQKDIYRFSAKPDNKGLLKYTNGIHIYRFYDKNNKFEDKPDYTDGSGLFKTEDNTLIWFDNKDNSKTEFIRANKELQKDTTVKNRLFSITLPEELNGIYEVKTQRDKISLFHKESKASGFGGFAFGLKAYKKPLDHAVLPGSRKLGELTDRFGNLYDIVLKHPTDVQYDYTKSTEIPETFGLLYDIGEIVNIKGINGATYFKNQGTKGEELYKDILKRHITAIDEKWDSVRLEKENMSYMYNVIAQTNKDVLNKIGYTYYDVNADGIEELLIGEITNGEWKGIIYDMYTMVNRKPKHVMSGGSRNRYYVCDKSFICNDYSSSAFESGTRVYNLVENSTELFPQVSFKLDGYANPKNPWFLSYGENEEGWKNISEDTFIERKKTFDDYERFDYIPLSTLVKDNISVFSLQDRYNSEKDYFDYSVVLKEFPKDYYYTTIKINKSKERILIITDKVTKNNNSYYGLFYYFAKNGFVYPLGYLESTNPLFMSKDYLYLNSKNGYIKFYMSDRNLSIVKSKAVKLPKEIKNIEFNTIKSADKFAGDFGEAAGDDVVKATLEGFYFEYHKPQYKKKYIKDFMKECINDGVKTQVQMYCCMVKKLHP